MRVETLPDPERYIDLDAVVLWDANYNEGDIGAIYTSINRYGFNGAIRLWKDNECRAGNHSTKALRICQREKIIPSGTGCLVYGEKYYVAFISIAHLDETEALAYAIADNNLARMASADEAMLTDYLERLSRMDSSAFLATGFDEDDLNQRLLERERNSRGPEEFPEYDETISTQFQCPKCGYEWSGKPNNV